MPVHANRRELLSAVAATAAFVVACPYSAAATPTVELLMFEETGCPWCVRWHAEVGPGYPRSSEGRMAPLRRLDIRGGAPTGMTLSAPVRATPTFVLVENGREVGRITGYPGADFFWGLLAGLLKKVAPAAEVEPNRQSAI